MWKPWNQKMERRIESWFGWWANHIDEKTDESSQYYEIWEFRVSDDSEWGNRLLSKIGHIGFVIMVEMDIINGYLTPVGYKYVKLHKIDP